MTVERIKELEKEIRDLRFSGRRQLLDKVLRENLQLVEENEKLKDERNFYANLFVNVQLRG